MNQHRVELVETLTELGTHYPDWRFGQLISNVTDWADVNLWDIEDEQIIATAKEHLRSVAKKKEMNTPRA